MSRQLTFVGDAEYQVKQASATSSSGVERGSRNLWVPSPQKKGGLAMENLLIKKLIPVLDVKHVYIYICI